jgi:hypothetical protein
VDAGGAFAALAGALLDIDARRSGDAAITGRALLEAMLPRITGDPLWRDEYEQFVSAVAFGTDAERIAFGDAVALCERMVQAVLSATSAK